MSSIIIPRTWTTQPQYPVDVNRSAPYGESIEVAINLTPALIESAKKVRATVTGTTRFSANRNGYGFDNDQNSYVGVDTGANWSTFSGYTVIILGTFGNYDAYGAIYAKQSTSGNNSAQLQIQNSNLIAVQHGAGGNAVFTSAGPFSPATIQASRFVAISWDKQNVRGYLDGILKETVPYTTDVASGTAALKIGAARDATTLAIAGVYNACFVFSKALPSAYIADLASNPWQLFRKQPQVLYFDVGGGGGGITGTLAATETGSDTAAFAGDVLIDGALAATESGSDSASFAGDVLIDGTLAATETGSDTAVFTGDASNVIFGTLTAAEVGSDSASFTGDILVKGTLAAVETGNDSAFFTGDASSAILGILAATEVGSDTAAFTGDVYILGTFAASELGADVAALIGDVYVSGSLAASEAGNDAAIFTGTAAAAITGTLAATETGQDTALFLGPVVASASVGWGGGKSRVEPWDSKWKRKKRFEDDLFEPEVMKPVARLDPVTEKIIPAKRGYEVAQKLLPKSSPVRTRKTGPSEFDLEEEELLLLL